MNFISPIFLWFTPLGALPVVIHLINRRKARRVDFPSLMFIQPSTKRRLLRFRLLEVLLLCVRVAVILLVTAAFARPVWRGFFAGDDGASYVLLIDNSYSMQYRTARGSALDLAKKAASEAVRRLDGRFAVAAFNNKIEDFTEHTSNKEKALHSIDKIEVTAFSTCYTGALQGLARLLEDEGPHRIIIFSDFNTDGFSSAGYHASKGLELLLVDVCDGGDNIWFERFEVPRAYAGIPCEFTAVLSPYSSPADVSLFFDGERRHRLEHPGGSDLRFKYTFSDPGLYRGWVKVEDDPYKNRLPMDSIYYFTVDVRPPVRVLLVEGSPGYLLMEGESFFAARALSPGTHRTFALPEIVTAHELAGRDLTPYDVLILFNARLGEEARKAVLSFSRSGGGVGVFSGDKTLDYAGLIRSLMPVEMLDAQQGAYGKGVFSPEARDGNYFQDIFGPDDRIRFEKIIRTKGGGGALPAIEADGTPLLWTYSPGGELRGNAAFFTSSANMRWNDFAVKPAYPAFIHELVKFLSETEEDIAVSKTVGSELRSEPGTVLNVITHDGEMNIPAPVATVPGIYETGSGTVAVNLDTATGESELSPADPGDIKSYFIGASVSYVPYSEELISSFLRHTEVEEKSGFFLISALILLVGEEILRKSAEALKGA